MCVRQWLNLGPSPEGVSLNSAWSSGDLWAGSAPGAPFRQPTGGVGEAACWAEGPQLPGEFAACLSLHLLLRGPGLSSLPLEEAQRGALVAPKGVLPAPLRPCPFGPSREAPWRRARAAPRRLSRSLARAPDANKRAKLREIYSGGGAGRAGRR